MKDHQTTLNHHTKHDLLTNYFMSSQQMLQVAQDREVKVEKRTLTFERDRDLTLG